MEQQKFYQKPKVCIPMHTYFPMYVIQFQLFIWTHLPTYLLFQDNHIIYDGPVGIWDLEHQVNA